MAIYAAVRAGALKSIGTGRGGILSTEYHAKRLDPVSQKRHIRDSDPIAWSKAEGPTDYVEAFKAHKRATGAGERKGADLGMELKVVVSPEWLAETGDPHDAANPRVQQLVEEAQAWAESWGGPGSVWGVRYDTDERGSGVVDVFMSPVREQRHKSGKSKLVISCRKAKEELLAAERALEPDLKTSGAAMQSSWARWARERVDPRLERGKRKEETGAVHQNADLYARIAQQKEADLLKREKSLAEREEALMELERKAKERMLSELLSLDEDPEQEARDVAECIAHQEALDRLQPIIRKPAPPEPKSPEPEPVPPPNRLTVDDFRGFSGNPEPQPPPSVSRRDVGYLPGFSGWDAPEPKSPPPEPAPAPKETVEEQGDDFEDDWDDSPSLGM